VHVTILEFTGIVFLGALLAGFLGALTGLGGGIVIVPLLTLALGVDIRYAIGTSLVAIIATSSGSSAAFTREGYTNVKVGMVLELATITGAIGGAVLATYLDASWLQTVFGVALIVSLGVTNRPNRLSTGHIEPDRFTQSLALDSTFPGSNGVQPYRVYRVPQSAGVMVGAGALSGLLGIGGGVFKVLAMDQIMRMPFKVSTTTSNFMIGVTAAASTGVYMGNGYIDPALTLPVVLGAMAGSLAGSRVLVRSPSRRLRVVFSVAIALVGIQMIYGGLTG
jgi:hypothetical protein